jgi:hypothetical protein
VISLVLAAAAAWTVTSSVDPMFDRRHSIATTTNGPVTLYVECREQERGRPAWTVGIRYVEFLASDAVRLTSFRFDDGKAVSDLWKYQNRDAFYQVSNPRVDPFVQGLKSGRRLLLRIEDVQGRLIDLRFRLPMDASALDRSINSCG